MTAVSDELCQQVQLWDALMSDIDSTLRRATPEDIDLATGLECRVTLGSASLALVRERLDTLLGEALGTYETVVPGFGMVKRHKKKDRTSWDKPDLLRAVLDTKLVDTETGEIVDETPLSKVTTVWNLGAPRLTALRDRGLEPDDFCSVEVRAGWQIEVK
jgi:hypothetical protein